MIGSGKIFDSLKALSARLRDERLRLNETQKVFAARIGVSVPTLYKMESGNHGVTLGLWAEALDLLGRLEDLDKLLAPKESLFDKYERTQKPKRQRASSKEVK